MAQLKKLLAQLKHFMPLLNDITWFCCPVGKICEVDISIGNRS